MTADCAGYYLSLNFGTRSIGVRNHELLETSRRSAEAYKAIPIYTRFRDRAIDLRGAAEAKLTRYNGAYEMAHICGRFYDRTSLRRSLLDDLTRMCEIYDRITPALSKRIVNGTLVYEDFARRTDFEDPADEQPGTYVAPPGFIERSTSRVKFRSGKSRARFDQDDAGHKLESRDEAHEALLNDFSLWLRQPRDEHNIHSDLYVSPSILIEAKTLSGDDEKQCRLALGQLQYLKYWYHHRYKLIDDPLLIALFDRKPTGKYGDLVAFFRHFSILTIWKSGSSFQMDQDFEIRDSRFLAIIGSSVSRT